MSFAKFLRFLAEEIKRAGQQEQDLVRILNGRCVYCNAKLPVDFTAYHCVPDCRSDLADRCNENEDA